MNRRSFLGSLLGAAMATLARFFPTPESKWEVESDYVEWISVVPRFGAGPDEWRKAAAVEALLNHMLHPHMPRIIADARFSDDPQGHVERIARDLYWRLANESYPPCLSR